MAYPVSLSYCTSYCPELVAEALRRLLEPLGGMAAFVKPGMRVLLKPNMLAGKPPEAAVTTHPVLVAAVVRQVRDCGGIALVGDSPGIGGFAAVANRTGIGPAAVASGASLVPFEETVRIAGQGVFKQLEVAKVYY